MTIRTVREEKVHTARTDDPGLLVHPEWQRSWPWLVQGTTTRGVDFRFGGPDLTKSWDRLRLKTGCASAVHAPQPHRAAVGVRAPERPGLHTVSEADAHLTRSPGTLLAVTTADCVPVSIVHPERRVVGVVHAGWRGAAAGVLERALDRMASAFAIGPDGVHLHLGPSICGSCYEVGPEVHEALGLDVPPGPEPIDLPGALARRAVAAGVHPDRITRSAWCTLCDGRALLHSHRGGDAGRQVGFVGLRLPGAVSP